MLIRPRLLQGPLPPTTDFRLADYQRSTPAADRYKCQAQVLRAGGGAGWQQQVATSTFSAQIKA
jgi:hypothetical protein